MSVYSMEHVARVVLGKLVGLGDKQRKVSSLIIDSRKIICPEEGLFFALKTSRNDGHNYLGDVYAGGVRCFVVEQLPNISSYPDAVFVVCENSLRALQTLSAWHRGQFPCLLVTGITGSNGKTIVKEWIKQLLGNTVRICVSPKSYNSQIGVPLSLWNLEPGDSYGLFEAGISQPGEMQVLEEIIQPRIGIFTNIASAHDENFTSMAEKINEKLKLFTRVHTLIYCIDSREIHLMVKASKPLEKVGKFTWGRSKEADIQIKNVVKGKKHTELYLQLPHGNMKTVAIPFTDEASIENAMHVFTWCYVVFPERDDISKQMLHLQPIAMRLELKEGMNRCSIINDAYSMDLYSLQIALDFLCQQRQHGKRTVILSDLLGSGKPEDELYGEIAGLLKRKGVQKMIGIGAAMCRRAYCFDRSAKFYPDTDTFLAQHAFGQFQDETILIKGARVFHFERIEKRLQRKTHETILEVNLNALVHNLNFYRGNLKPGVKTAVMVKAFTYGSGSFEIANVLQFNHVDYLIVAFTDEGVELRRNGIMLPILVLNPEENSFDLMKTYRLEPEIYSFRMLRLLLDYMHASCEEVLPIHVKLDTGMHRLGFSEEDIPELTQQLRQEPLLKTASVFSHLAVADNPMQEAFTKKQITLFNTMSRQICEAFPYAILRHLCNTAGITACPEAHFDMVRLGIGIHGIGVGEGQQKHLEPVSTLKTIISQIHTVSSGDTVGYNRRWKAWEDSRIATIPIGYADGLNRKLGNENGKVRIKGKEVPIIGDICMDMCMVNVTGIECEEGDEVIIFGKEYPVQNIAQAINTIPYEIFTGLSQRIKRVYCYE